MCQNCIPFLFADIKCPCTVVSRSFGMIECLKMCIRDRYSPKFSSEKLALKLGLNLPDIDMFEINEAFASQAYAVRRDLGLDKNKVNIYGGGISIGHPIGATGCVLTVKVLYELMRTDKKDAMISMCIGGGQGISMYFTKC